MALVVAGLPLFAQIQFTPGSGTAFGQRVYFGGNFSLQFGSLTYIDVSPLAGYMITRNFSAGLGVTYRYLRYKDNYYNINYSSNIYGGRLFLRHNISLFHLPLFLYSEYEDLSVAVPVNNSPDRLSREWIPSLFAGGGLFQPIGQRAGFTIMFLYNLIYDVQRTSYLYPQPYVIRVGFTL